MYSHRLLHVCVDRSIVHLYRHRSRLDLAPRESPNGRRRSAVGRCTYRCASVVLYCTLLYQAVPRSSTFCCRREHAFGWIDLCHLLFEVRTWANAIDSKVCKLQRGLPALAWIWANNSTRTPARSTSTLSPTLLGRRSLALGSHHVRLLQTVGCP